MSYDESDSRSDIPLEEIDVRYVDEEALEGFFTIGEDEEED